MKSPISTVNDDLDNNIRSNFEVIVNVHHHSDRSETMADPIESELLMSNSSINHRPQKYSYNTPPIMHEIAQQQPNIPSASDIVPFKNNSTHIFYSGHRT
ncbi:hypothetical protein PV325_004564 [Microctonus aethiopoides]|uniref:Uncharacterized protein n=1 Tax=Microctonus aethiopoides TaxID=144406 RepID=A0AA39C959_9HYME|nr:hypothetical protein PV325_004564 [Microctonus aethiopoides]KAK0087357.1 hypothetical protein PV326_005221 [Microctonus aethiopoides]KAK0160195.1 hypothetical protein PV328_007623 [Microctonus aethiopoides]